VEGTSRAYQQMITFKVLLEYDGTRYSGWQDQKNARTVMGELKKAAVEVFHEAVDMHGAGRTDAGVHALGQVAHIKIATPVREPLDRIKRRLNELLPADIAVLDIEKAPRNFHARHDALARTYVYQISTRKQAFMKRYVWWVKEDLDVNAMKQGASMFVGRHDFICFRAADSSRPGESTIVVVDKVEIETEEEIISCRIEASHFLWRMVRRLVGVLVKLGQGEITQADLSALLQGRCNSKFDVAAWTAPAAGLFLEHVRYPDFIADDTDRRHPRHPR
jgi:tRNA pseudouridine38-40 synthase